MERKKGKEGVRYYDVTTGKYYQYVSKHDKYFLITTDLKKIWEEPKDENNLIER